MTTRIEALRADSTADSAAEPGPSATAPAPIPGDAASARKPESELDSGAAPEVDSGPGDVVEHEPGLGPSVRAPDPHSPLNTPIGEPDPTEWPDPYDRREDPRDAPGDEMPFGGDANHTPTGATSTSEPHPDQDPEALPSEAPQRDRLDR